MMWAIFAGAVAALFAADLLSKGALAIRGALIRTALYVASAVAFGAYIWSVRGPADALKFYTGYTLETSLSLDNVFVMSLIFGALNIPAPQRHRVLLWGVLSAVVLRGVFTGSGLALVGAFDWLLLICGAFLIYTGAKSLLADGAATVDLETNAAYRALQRWVPITPLLFGNKFFAGRRATPLFVALVLVEIADLIFAADSVPATLAVTQDPLLVYTSNIFAILGLRSLYLVLEAAVSKFEYVGKAVSIVLMFVGAKVVLAHPLPETHIPDALSLAAVLVMLSAGFLFSLVKRGPNVSA